MSGRLRFGVTFAAMLAMAALPLLPADASAQTGRFRVMVTQLVPENDADDDFGKDLAKELRELINELPTHQPVDEDDIKDAAKRYDLDMKEIGCIQALQLATQINSQLVMCGSYTEDDQAKTFSLKGLQFAAPGGGTFAIEDKTWGEKDHEIAAQEIFTAFEGYVEQLRVAVFCGDYFDSQQWDSALNNCTRALEMNPADTQVRYIYSRLLMELDRNEEAYEEVKKVVEQDQLHEGGLQTAGYLAATMGNREEARGYYNTYLQLNPGSANVRMQIAYDLAQAGDPAGAMILVEEGLDIETDNVDLRLQHAAFAVAAARDAMQGVQLEEGQPLPAEPAELYTKALESYDVAYQVRGEEMEAAHLRNMIAGYNELGQVDEAVTMAERALATHDQEAQLWSIYADVLKKAERIDDAIQALDETATRDAEYANVRARQGSWLLEAGRDDDALPYIREAVERGEQSADAMAQLIFATGHRKGVAPTPKNWGYAIQMFEIAKSFEVSDNLTGQFDFWHAYALFNQAKDQQEPQTLQTAQSSLPKFQQAMRLFGTGAVQAYAESQPTIQLQQFLDATQTYIEIQEAIIQRGS